MGTQRKFYRNNKNSTMPPSLERKKKLGSFGCMLLHFIGCKNSFCLHVFFFGGSWIIGVNSFLFFSRPHPLQWAILMAHHKNYTNFRGSPKYRFILEGRVTIRLVQRSASEKKTTLGKTYGIKVWCYCEHPGKHMGTWWGGGDACY